MDGVFGKGSDGDEASVGGVVDVGGCFLFGSEVLDEFDGGFFVAGFIEAGDFECPVAAAVDEPPGGEDGRVGFGDGFEVGVEEEVALIADAETLDEGEVFLSLLGLGVVV